MSDKTSNVITVNQQHPISPATSEVTHVWPGNNWTDKLCTISPSMPEDAPIIAHPATDYSRLIRNDRPVRDYDEDTSPIKEHDPVNHPAHYTYGAIETIDYIEDKGQNFNLGNAVKYVSRAGHKIDAVEDLKKAVWYINREIARLEKEKK